MVLKLGCGASDNQVSKCGMRLWGAMCAGVEVDYGRDEEGAGWRPCAAVLQCNHAAAHAFQSVLKCIVLLYFVGSNSNIPESHSKNKSSELVLACRIAQLARHWQEQQSVSFCIAASPAAPKACQLTAGTFADPHR